ncbi:uncharacterized protein A4U43_C10F8400 [Asparagus officinalis]|uniref:Uncharacterized protein n=1 Tax=Asparagus officinalis TaxID=4686 RepID=A0A5P1E4L6_ASPOF|nr:uncharacterized protein A4U43_C10F8400 [Asparagus officinalis]
MLVPGASGMRFGMGVQTDSCAQALGELRDLEPLLDPHFRWRSLKDGLEFSGGARRKRGETHLIKVIAQASYRVDVGLLLPFFLFHQCFKLGGGANIMPGLIHHWIGFFDFASFD